MYGQEPITATIVAGRAFRVDTRRPSDGARGLFTIYRYAGTLFAAVYEQVEIEGMQAVAEAGMAVHEAGHLEVLRAGCQVRSGTVEPMTGGSGGRH